jgi:DNA-binding LacI/PurR family transcriptional regulator
MSATISDIARLAETSTASVSLYLNDRNTNRVGVKVKGRIDEAVEKLNYRPHLFARSLSKHASNTVGMIFPTLRPLFINPYTNGILAGIQSVASEHHFNLLFFPTIGETSKEVTRFQVENSMGCDGYILFSTRFCRKEDIESNIKQIKRTKQAFVTINIPYQEEDINQVIIPGLEDAYGVDYLVKKGHKYIMLMAGRKDGINTSKIVDSYKKYIEAANLRFKEEYILYADYNSNKAKQLFSEYFSKYPEVTAICSMSDLMALGVYSALYDMKLSVGQDVSVIGRNNSDFSALMHPPLTTVDLHMFEAGVTVQRLLIEAIRGEAQGKKEYVESDVIERSSVSTN